MAELVQITGEKISVNTKTLAETKIALKELKLKKKMYALSRRTVMDKQKDIRAQYTQEVRSRDSLARGNSGFSKIIRSFQTISRDSQRSNLSKSFEPLEYERRKIEAMISALDSAIIQVEEALLNESKII